MEEYFFIQPPKIFFEKLRSSLEAIAGPGFKTIISERGGIVMKKIVLFIHSAGPQTPGQGSNGLTSYLQKELGDDMQLICHSMPAPENPKYKAWKEQIDLALQDLQGEILLVGHSLGGSVLLKYLSEESCPVTVSGLFIVAAPFWGLDSEWQLKDFMLHANFENSLPFIPYIFLYHSYNENVVPFSHHEAYSEKIPWSMTRRIQGDKHLFLAGLPALIEDIKNL